MARHVLTLNRHSTLLSAAHLLRLKRIGAVPIVDGDDSLVGILTRTDRLDAFIAGEGGADRRGKRRTQAERDQKNRGAAGERENNVVRGVQIERRYSRVSIPASGREPLSGSTVPWSQRKWEGIKITLISDRRFFSKSNSLAKTPSGIFPPRPP
jgi:hypothetical protein